MKVKIKNPYINLSNGNHNPSVKTKKYSCIHYLIFIIFCNTLNYFSHKNKRILPVTPCKIVLIVSFIVIIGSESNVANILIPILSGFMCFKKISGSGGGTSQVDDQIYHLQELTAVKNLSSSCFSASCKLSQFS